MAERVVRRCRRVRPGPAAPVAASGLAGPGLAGGAALDRRQAGRGGWLRAWLLGGTALLPASGAAQAQLAPNARPSGGQVVAGSASIAQGGTTTTVTQTSQRAAVNWQQFNVGANQSVQFVQPNAQAATLNRVVGPDPSVIAGRITATTATGGAGGTVAIVNQSGVVFANGSQVNVGTLIASAANITNENFMAGRMVFDGAARPGARVENHGTITVADRGLAALVGPRVANTGMIQGRLARVALQGGAETYSLDLAGDGMLAIDVTQAVRGSGNGVALATNSGVIEAPGGQVLISAHAASGLVEDLVRNTGRISANGAEGRAGQVALRAEGGNLRIEGVVEARGAAAGQAGGRIRAEAVGGAVTVAAGARVSASGEAGGGSVEIGGRTTRSAELQGSAMARSRRGRGGQVAVQAAESVTLAPGARVDVSGRGGGGTALIGTEGLGRDQVMAARTTIATGATVRADATGAGTGGTIAVNSGAETDMRGALSARGGRAGGDGGFIEVSAQGAFTAPELLSRIDLAAPAGGAGTLLLDPTTIEIVTAGGTPATANVAAGAAPATLLLTPASINVFVGHLTLEATTRITVTDSVTKTAGDLTLRVTTAVNAVSDGIFVNAALTMTGGGGAVTLDSRNGLNRAGRIGINANIATTGGGQSDITIRSGSVVTAAGASVSARRDLTITTDSLVTGAASGLAAARDLTVTASGDIGLGSGAVSAGRNLALTASGTGAAAGGISLGGNLSAPAGTVTLTAAADKPVTQAAGTAIATPSLTVTDSGSIALGNAGNAIGTLAQARATDAVVVRSDVSKFTVQAVAGRGVTLTKGLAGGEIIVAGAVTGRRTAGGASQDVALTGDALTITGAGSVTGRTVTLRPFGDDTAVALGGVAAPNILGIDAASLGRVTADTLVVRATGTGGITVDAALDRGAGTLDLEASSIGQALDAAITAGALRAVATAGAVTLDTVSATPNQVGILAGSATTDFAFDNGAALAVGSVGGSSGIAATGRVELRARAGDLTQTEAITGGVGLRAVADAGAVTLGHGGNAVARIAGRAGTDFTLRSTQALEVGSVGAGAGITAGAGRTVALRAGTGDLTQSQAITGSGGGGVQLSAIADAGAVRLGDAGNAILRVAGTAATDVTVTSAQAMEVGLAGASAGITAGAGRGVALRVLAGDLTQTEAILGGVDLQARAESGSVLLGHLGNAVARVAGSAGSGFAVVSGQAMEVAAIGAFAGIAAPGVTELRSTTGDLTQSAAIAGGGSLRAVSDAGAVILDHAGNAVATVAGSAATGFTLRSTQALEVGSVGASSGVAATTTVDLRAGAGDLTQSQAITGGAVLTATADAGSVTLGDTGNAVAGVAGSAAADFSLFSTQALETRGTGVAAVAGHVALTSGVSLGVTPGAPVSGASVTLRADQMTIQDRVAAPGGEITLRPHGAAVPVTLGGAGAGLVIDGGALDLLGGGGAGGTAPPASRLRIVTGAGVTIAGPVALRGRFGALALEAGGAVSQGAFGIDVARLVVGAGGAVALADAGATNSIDEVAVRLTGGVPGTVAVRATGTPLLTVVEDASSGIAGIGGAATPGSVSLAGNALTLAASVSGGTVTLAADGAVAQSAGTLTASTLGVQGLSGASVAAIQLDRAGNAIATLGDARATGGIAVRSDVAGITMAGTIRSGTGDVALRNGQAGGALVLNGSRVEAPAGTVTLTADSLSASGIGVQASGRHIAIVPTSAGDMLVDGAPGAGSVVAGSLLARLAATESLTIGGGAARDVIFGAARSYAAIAPELRVVAGRSILQTAASGLTATTLRATASTGSILLDGAQNNVAGLEATATAGSVTLRNQSAIGVLSVAAGGTVELTAAAGNITQSGAIGGTTLTAQAMAGQVQLGGLANAVTGLAGNAASDFSFRNASGFVVGALSGGAVTLRADTGSITQSAAIASTSLQVTALSGDIALGSQANQGVTVAGSAGGSFAYRDLNDVSFGRVQAGGAVTLTSDTGSLSQSDIISGTALSATAMGGEVALGGIANAVTSIGGGAGSGFAFRNGAGFDVTGIAAPGAPVTLTADAGGIVQSGSIAGTTLTVTATGGAVDLGTRANQLAGVDITAGGPVAYRDLDDVGVLGIAASGAPVTLTSDSGGITQSGAIAGAALTVTASSGSVDLGTQANMVTSLQGSAGGSLAFRDADGFVVASIGAGGAVTLTADAGAITQSGVISGTALTATAAAGSVDLGTRANTVTSVQGSAGGSFAFRDADGFVVAGIGAGGAVTLVADGGGITQSGAIGGTTLTVTASAGSVDLGTQANTVTSVQGSAGGGFAFRDADGVVVAGIGAGGAVTLVADSGSVTQSGAISGTALTARATTGSVDLGTQANMVTSVQGSAGGSFAFRGGDAVVAGRIQAGGAVALTSDTGSITQSDRITGTALTVTATAGSADLGTQANAVTSVQATTGGGFGLRDADGFTVTGIGAGGAVTLAADNGAITQSGVISGTALTATATAGSVDLGTRANTVTSLQGSAGGSFAFRDADGVVVAGINAGGAVTLTADSGAITQSGVISGTALTAAAGSVDLGSQANAVTSVQGSAGGGFAFRNGTGFDVAGIGAGGAVMLTADSGALTQSGVISGTALTATAGSVDLGTRANAVTSVQGSAGGSFAFRDADGFVVAGIGAGGAVTLMADSGAITQSGAITGTALTATAGSVDLGTRANTVTSLQGSAGGSFAFRNGTGFDVAGIDAGGAVTLTADAGAITQSGAITGTALTVAAGSVELGTQANRVSTVGGTAGSVFAYRDADGFDVTGIGAGGAVSLRADSGSITQSGTISGTALTVTATAGSTDLGTRANAVTSVQATTGGGFALRDADGFTVTGIGAGGAVTLAADAGTITQSGVISGTALTATAGSVDLGTQANMVTSLQGSAGTSFAFRDTDGFDITGIGAGGAVTLVADSGSITQSGAITGTALTVAAGSVDLGSQANTVTSLQGSAGGGLAFRNGTGFVVAGIDAGGAVTLTADAGTITQSGAISGTALTATATTGSIDLGTQANRVTRVQGSTGGSFAFRDADGFDVAGIAAGAAVTLTADSGAITQSGVITGTALTAAAGSVDLGTRANAVTSVQGSAGTRFAFRDADGFVVAGIGAGGAVSLTADSGAITQSGVISGTALTVAAGSVDLGTRANMVTSVQGSAGGSFAFRNGTGFDVVGIDAGGAVSLVADAGTITQSGAITGTALTVAAGSVELGTQANRVATVGGTAGSVFAYRDADGVDVTGIAAGGAVSLRADSGSITQGGTIAGTALTVTATAGSADLGTRANAVTSVQATTGGGFALRDADGFTVTGIGAGGAVTLAADAGTITQSGAISGTALTATATAGSVDLGTRANTVTSLQGRAGTSFAFRDADGVVVAGIGAGGAVTLTADSGAITQSGVISGTALTATAAAGSVDLGSQANAVTSLQGSAGGGLAFRNGTGFVVAGIGAGGAVTLTADSGAITQSGAITGTALTAAAGSVDLGTRANAVTSVQGSTGGSFAFRDADGFDVAGIAAGAAVTLTADSGAITQSGVITGTALTAAAGSVDLGSQANAVTSLQGSAGTSFAFRDADGFVVAGIGAGGAVSLIADSGAITQSGLISGTALTATAGSVDLGTQANMVTSLQGSAGGSFAFRNGTGFDVAGIDAGGAVTLVADSGAITQSGAITGTALTAAAGSVDLGSQANRVTSLQGSAGTSFAFRDADGFDVTGIGAGGAVSLSADAGAITQSGAITGTALTAAAGSVDLGTRANAVTSLQGSAGTSFAFRNGAGFDVTGIGAAGAVLLRADSGSITQSGTISGTALTVNATAGSADLGTRANAVTSVQATTGGGFAFRNGTSFDVVDIGAGATVTLTADTGSIGQTGAIGGTALTATAAGGAVDFGALANAVTSVGGASGTGFAFRNGGGFTVTGIGAGGAVTLTADAGAITQSGAITATALTVAAGSVDLGTQANAVASVQGSAGGSFAFRNGTGFDVAGIGAGGAVTLTADAGTITQSGVISGSALTATAGSVDLGSQANAVTSLQGSTGGSFAFRDADGFDVTGIDVGGAVSLVADSGAITQSGAITGTALTAAAGSVDLGSQANRVTSLQGSAGTSFAFRDADGFDVTAIGAGGAVTLSADAGAITQSGAITGTVLTAAAGSVDLGTRANAVTSLQGSAGTSFAFRNGAGFDVTGIGAAGAVLLRADSGSITQSGTISGTALTVNATAGSADLGTRANAVTSVQATTGGGFAFRNGTSFDVVDIGAGATVTLTADTGSIGQTGAIGGTALTATAAGGAVDFGALANAVTSVGGASGTGFAFRNGGGVTVTGINAGGAVTLTADTGTITQTGAITGTALTATATAGAIELGTQANRVTSLQGSAGTSFAFRNGTGFDVAGIDAGGAVTLVATSGSAGTTFRNADAGIGVVTLVADSGSITQSGAITGTALTATAIGGLVDLGTRANTVTSLQGSAGTSFAFRNGTGFDVAGIDAGGAVSLTADSGAITQSGAITGTALTAAAGSVDLGSQANRVTSLQGSAGTSFAFRDADGFDVTGIGAGGAVTLVADSGSITQSGAISGTALTATATGGSVILGTQANRVAAVGGTAGSVFAYRDADGFDVTGIAAGGAVSLRADSGSITQSGTIAGTGLDVRAPGGAVALTLANALGSAGGVAGTSFALRNTGSLAIDGITAGSTVDLTSVTGDVTQTGAIRGTALTVSAATPGRSILLDGAVNSVDRFTASAGADVLFLNDRALVIAGITTPGSGGLALRVTGGGISQTGAIVTGRMRARSDTGGVDLTHAGNRIDTAAGSAGTSFALRNAQALQIGTVLGTAGIAAPTVDLQVTTGDLTQGAAVTANGLRLRVEAGSALLTGSNAIGTLSASAAGDIRVVSGSGMATGSVAGGSGVISTGAGATTIALTTTAGDLVQGAGNITALGTGATVSLVSQAGSIAQAPGGIIATRRLSLAAAGGVQLPNTNAFDTLVGADFGAAGGVLRGTTYAVTGAVGTGGSVSLLATGAITLGGPGTTPPVTAGGGIAIAADAGPVSVGASSLQAGGGITLSGAGGLALAGTQIGAGGDLVLAAAAGGLTLTNATITIGGRLSGTAAADTTLSGVVATSQGPLGIATQGGLQVLASRLAASSADPLDGVVLTAGGAATLRTSQLSAANRVAVQAKGPLGIDSGTLAAETAYLAGQSVTLGTVTAQIGRSLLVAGPGGVTNTAPLTLVPRAAGQFPMLVYDTRAVPAQSAEAILAHVQPDLPGRQPGQQPTQLRSAPGVESADPFFGAASSAAAGPVAAMIQAPGSPVLLLLDGGTATGTLVAGRLLVHGTGGRADLQGTLAGLAGAEAAPASDITRPVSGASLADYRVNGCVIGSINCVVTPRFQPIPPGLRTNLQFSVRQNAFNPADVIIPNTGENDYE